MNKVVKGVLAVIFFTAISLGVFYAINKESSQIYTPHTKEQLSKLSVDELHHLTDLKLCAAAKGLVKTKYTLITEIISCTIHEQHTVAKIATKSKDVFGELNNVIIQVNFTPSISQTTLFNDKELTYININIIYTEKSN